MHAKASVHNSGSDCVDLNCHHEFRFRVYSQNICISGTYDLHLTTAHRSATVATVANARGLFDRKTSPDRYTIRTPVV